VAPPWKSPPIDFLIDFSALKTMDVLEIGCGSDSHPSCYPELGLRMIPDSLGRFFISTCRMGWFLVSETEKTVTHGFQ
jgi:hypothetical protein